MTEPYEIFLRSEAIESLRGIRGTPRKAIAGFIDSLALSPSSTGDYTVQDVTGRVIYIKDVGPMNQQSPRSQPDNKCAKQKFHRKPTGGAGKQRWRIGAGFMKNVVDRYGEPEAISQLFGWPLQGYGKAVTFCWSSSTNVQTCKAASIAERWFSNISLVAFNPMLPVRTMTSFHGRPCSRWE